MVNRSKPKWWKWSLRSYRYFAVGGAIISWLLVYSVYLMGFARLQSVLFSLLAFPIILFLLFSPTEIRSHFFFITLGAGPGSMIGFFVFLFYLGINPIPGVALSAILGGMGGYLADKRWNLFERFPIYPRI